MYIIIGIVGVVALLFCVYLVLIAPQGKNQPSFKEFEQKYIAHRGFFDNKSESPENSLSAFRKAVEGGYGIELDVHITKDEKIVVFHDDSLERMCGKDILIEDCTYLQLQEFCLMQSQEKIPLFTDVLKLVDGKAPLIVEIKNSKRWERATRLTAKILDEYKGSYCVESFNPLVIAWYKKNRPNVVRGVLSTDYFKGKYKMDFFKKFLLTNLMLNFKAKPNFIAYNHLYKNQFSYKLIRKLYSVKNVAWTIRSQNQLEDAKDVFTCIIFEGFTPEEKNKD